MVSVSVCCLDIEMLFGGFIFRCCVKGSLLEVNDRLIKQPGLLNSSVRFT